MTEKTKMIEHDVIGLLNSDGSDIVQYCHERHKVGECPWCDFIRVEHIVDDFSRRVEVSGLRIKSLNMWSLGSSLKDTLSNRKRLLKWWGEFHGVVKRVPEWVPLFRVMEVGKRGFLHFHVLVCEYVPHELILRVWRGITGELSNVHVSGSGRGRDPTLLIRYLVKYLTKESSAYRWMGPLYGLGSRSRAVRSSDGLPSEKLRYGGVTYMKVLTVAYGEKRDSQRKI